MFKSVKRYYRRIQLLRKLMAVVNDFEAEIIEEALKEERSRIKRGRK